MQVQCVDMSMQTQRSQTTCKGPRLDSEYGICRGMIGSVESSDLPKDRSETVRRRCHRNAAKRGMTQKRGLPNTLCPIPSVESTMIKAVRSGGVAGRGTRENSCVKKPK
jgi:hypothetical protein